MGWWDKGIRSASIGHDDRCQAIYRVSSSYLFGLTQKMGGRIFWCSFIIFVYIVVVLCLEDIFLAGLR